MGISPKLLNEGETVVIHTRTHGKALVVPVLWLVVLLAIGIAGQIWLGGTPALIVWALVLIAGLWLVGWRLLEWATSTYTVTTRRLITRHGVITRRGHDIPLSRISDVAYELDIIDRILRCGTLIISDASTHGQVVLHDIPHVEESQRKINELLNKIHDGEQI
ncbi:PH domain-containing protein [Nocardioides sp.]|uniref:PH domain-containing protein n=1 Tax=Nocardioides sp. TaxID=35761 RepID=UPI0039E521C0